MTPASATRPVLYLLVKNPFGPRDYARMGIAELSRHFDVRILDCTAWLMPVALGRQTDGPTPARVRPVRSARELLAAIDGTPDAIALEYVGVFSLRSFLLFWLLRWKRVRVAVMDSGNVPYPGRREGQQGIVAWLRANRGMGPFRMAAKIATRIVTRFVATPRVDVSIISGTYSLNDARCRSARVVVPSHSFDCETFRQLAATPRLLDGRYAVYLDEKITGHEDDAELGLPPVASEAVFGPALLEFFRAFTRVTGCRVVIAAYPSSDRDRLARVFPGHEAFHGRACELVRDAELVFAHASTATSFAILARRPIVHLVSSEIEQGWYHPWVLAMAEKIGVPVHNIDAGLPPRDDVAKWFVVDDGRYQQYEREFLRAPGCSDESLWVRTASALSSRTASTLTHPFPSKA